MIFSIIVPVYNVEKYLKQCLDSVRGQTFDDWECICINDGSTDGSAKILEDYALCDNRIRVVSKKNGGPSAARNVGLSMIRGDYVVFFDSDDVLAPWMLARLAASLFKNKVDLLRYGFVPFVEDVPREECGKELDDWVWTEDDLRRKLIEEFENVGCMVWLDAIKADLATLLKFDEEVLVFEDILYSAKLIDKVKTATVLDSNCYYYRQAIGTSLTHRTRASREGADFARHIVSIWRETQHREQLRRFFNSRLCFGLKHWMRACPFIVDDDVKALHQELKVAYETGLLSRKDWRSCDRFGLLAFFVFCGWRLFISTGAIGAVSSLYRIYFALINACRRLHG